MNILLIEADADKNATYKTKIPNHALMKISSYYKGLKHNVGFNITDPDIIYVSCIFEENKVTKQQYQWMYPNAEIHIGGPGANYNQLPIEIENASPDYDLYPQKLREKNGWLYSQGFTTRGCTKKCPYCVVPDKEGKFSRYKTVQSFASPRYDTVMLMDNNILADKEWFLYNTDYILEHDLKVIEHGMDVNYLDDEIAERLSQLKFANGYMHFAWDNAWDENKVLDSIEILKNAGINIRQHVRYYVLVGYLKDDYEYDIYRCNTLKEQGTNAYVMRYGRYPDGHFYNRLARWANSPRLFWKFDFEKYDRSNF